MSSYTEKGSTWTLDCQVASWIDRLMMQPYQGLRSLVLGRAASVGSRNVTPNSPTKLFLMPNFGHQYFLTSQTTKKNKPSQCWRVFMPFVKRRKYRINFPTITVLVKMALFLIFSEWRRVTSIKRFCLVVHVLLLLHVFDSVHHKIYTVFTSHRWDN